MAKQPFTLAVEIAAHTDPVTRKTTHIVRKAHNDQSSTRLKNFQHCVATHLRGHTYRGSGAVEDSIRVRDGFTAAAKSCAGGGR